MQLSSDVISNIILGLLLALGTLATRWNSVGRKKNKKIKKLEANYELARALVFAQRDQERLHNDKEHPLTSDDPEGNSRIKILVIPQELRTAEIEFEEESE